MDSIIWVEGETDEECFPMILSANKVPLLGSKILRIAHTGDFTDRRHSASAVKLYRRLSHGNALLPPALAFVFDSDMEADLDHVRAELGSQVKLLPRQNYESYLIEATPITRVLKKDDPDNANDYSQEAVQDWIDQHHMSDHYYPKKPFEADNWLFCIDGARFLGDLFGKITEHRVEYRKIDHTLRLTKLLLADNPSHFQEIVDLISSILDRAN